MSRRRQHENWPETANDPSRKTSMVEITSLDDNNPIFIKESNYALENSSEPTISARISEFIGDGEGKEKNLICKQEVINLTDDTPTTLSDDPLLLERQTFKTKKRKPVTHKDRNDIERRIRLSKMAEYAARRLAKETPHQRAVRLKKMSLYTSQKLASETSEERAIRLAKMSAYTAQRLAAETIEQRRARLQKMSAYSARRKVKNTDNISSESSDSTKLHD